MIDVGSEAGVAMYQLDNGATECPRSWQRASEAGDVYELTDVATKNAETCPAGTATVTYDDGENTLDVEVTWGDGTTITGTLTRA